MERNEQFETAVAESKSLPARPDNETLLRLYGLYKQATSGDAPEKSGFNMFDFVAKAKYEAWKKLQGMDPEAAKLQYIELVAALKAKP